MARRYDGGTPMGGTERSPARRRRDATRRSRMQRSTAQAGPVTITRRDGTTETQQPYTRAQALRIVDG